MVLNLALLNRPTEQYDVGSTLDKVQNYQGHKIELYTIVMIVTTFDVPVTASSFITEFQVKPMWEQKFNDSDKIILK